jgi:hypothetical protein
MNQYFYFILGFILGGVLGIVIGWLMGYPNRKERDDLKFEKILLLRSEKLGSATTIMNNTKKINNHEERIEILENQMAKAFQWFGSMIRHSAEEPFKKEAIEKFLAEEELKK